MRRRTRQTLAALLNLVLLLCLAPVSFAADAIDLTKPNTVKINLVKGIPEFEGDIETALIQADFYLLAKAKPVTIDGVTYSADINNSSMVALNPLFKSTGLFISPKCFRRLKFCIFLAPT